MPRGGGLAWQHRAHLASNGLAAGSAGASGDSCDAQLLQVPGEAAQHGVQRGLGLRWHPGFVPRSRQLLGRRTVRDG